MGLLPFFHIYGMVVIMSWALYKGATVVTMPRFDMEQFLATDAEVLRSPTRILVPPIILGLAKHPVVAKYDLSKLRLVCPAPRRWAPTWKQAVQPRLNVSVMQGYGMTEASPVTHFRASRRPESPRAAVSACRSPTQRCGSWTSPRGRTSAPNQDGELLDLGAAGDEGLPEQPGATAATVDDEGWLHTGDIGYADEDGYFWIVDRLKELIKYNGYQVAPAELEAILVTHPAVADAAVVGVRDEEAGELPKAFVVRRGEVTEEEIMAFVADRVAPYKRIRLVEFIEQVPKSPTGKILRRMLKTM